MIIMKFGGTSVGTAARIAATADIIASATRPAIVVLSAMSGATNELLEIARGAKSVDALRARHHDTASELQLHADTDAAIDRILNARTTEAETVACGELLSTTIMHALLRSRGLDAAWLPALDYMRTDSCGEPDTESIARLAAEAVAAAGPHDIYITQGFICRDADGNVATLTRGGSDYTATLLGEAMHASEVQIWTDVDGVYSADPRKVNGARCIPSMSYRQADTAARLGAKILHPDCVRPARRAGCTLRVLDSFHSDAPGTVVGDFKDAPGFIAVAARSAGDGLTEVSLVGSDDYVPAQEVAKYIGGGLTATSGDGYTSMLVPDHIADDVMRKMHKLFIE